MVGLYIWCSGVGMILSFVALILGAAFISDAYPKLEVWQSAAVVVLTLVVSVGFALIGGWGYQQLGGR